MYSNVAIVVSVLVVIWLLRNLFPAKHKPRLAQLARQSGDQRPFRAVSINASSRACDPARALKGQRFLSRNTPILPLEGCGSRECRCVYVHHADRRKGDGGRRKSRQMETDYALRSGQLERRSGVGRRSGDFINQLAMA